MQRLGSYEWARATGGSLTGEERRRLIGAVARSYHRLLIDRLRLALGRVPDEARRIDPDSIVAPDSAFAREGEVACAEQPEAVIGHSYRTWILGSALAQLDGESLDPELFYVGSLLHDAGIADVVPDQDFTIRSAEAAVAVGERAGLEAGRMEEIADGVCGHFTPGATVEVDGAIAVYIQSGAVADLLGLRAADVSPGIRGRALEQHPKNGTGREFAAYLRAEGRAVPRGRAALLNRWAAFHLAARFGPS